MITILAILIVVGGVFFYLKQTHPEFFIDIKEVPAPAVTIDTSDWKEFRSEKFGIAFKTPADWNNVEEEGVINLDDFGHDARGWIFILENLKTKRNLLNFFSDSELKQITKFYNQDGVEVYSVGRIYYLIIKDSIYEFTGAQEQASGIIYSLQII